MKLAKSFILWTFCLGASSVFAGDMVEGGMSGGGGNLVESPAAGTQAVHEVISTARSHLYFYFQKYFKVDRNSDQVPSIPAGMEYLFENSNQNIFTELENTRIHTASNETCLDRDGKQKDGSDSWQSPHVPGAYICISSYRLGKKLSKDNSFAQTLALVSHEMAHRLGANEAEAVALQKRVLSDLSKEGTVAVWSTSNEFEHRLMMNIHYFNDMKNNSNLNVDIGCGLGKLAADTFSSSYWVQFVMNKNFGLDAEQARGVYLNQALAQFVHSSFCAISNWTTPGLYRNSVDQIFKGKEEVTLAEVVAHTVGVIDPRISIPNVTFRRFTQANFKAEITRAVNAMSSDLQSGKNRLSVISNLRN